MVRVSSQSKSPLSDIVQIQIQDGMPLTLRRSLHRGLVELLVALDGSDGKALQSGYEGYNLSRTNVNSGLFVF